MPSAYLQWRFHSGERVVARGPLVSPTDHFNVYPSNLSGELLKPAKRAYVTDSQHVIN